VRWARPGSVDRLTFFVRNVLPRTCVICCSTMHDLVEIQSIQGGAVLNLATPAAVTKPIELYNVAECFLDFRGMFCEPAVSTQSKKTNDLSASPNVLVKIVGILSWESAELF
jgi:hypothetical protein